MTIPWLDVLLLPGHGDMHITTTFCFGSAKKGSHSEYPKIQSRRSAICELSEPFRSITVALLVTALVRFLVFVFLEVSLLAVIQIMRAVALAFAHALLVPSVFRIVVSFVLSWSWKYGAATTWPAPPQIATPIVMARTQLQCLEFIVTSLTTVLPSSETPRI